jgi:hypothetical protein
MHFLNVVFIESCTLYKFVVSGDLLLDFSLIKSCKMSITRDNMRDVVWRFEVGVAK